MRVAITGATGFIGSQLINKIIEQTNWSIVAISRNLYEWNTPRVEHRTADFYSLLDTEMALNDCDIAIYLVHSMEQTDRLSQGHFSDFDFILADNFARAAEKQKLKHIYYVGGIIPKKQKLSSHLLSRLEVEKTLMSRSTPCTSLRCGLVIGSKGSSFEIMSKLVDRLPIMLLPSWTNTKLQPIDIDDLCNSLIKSMQSSRFEANHIYELCNNQVISYKDLITKYAKVKNKKLIHFSIPFVPAILSSLWISLISGKSLALVHPLIESICDHNMLKQNQFEDFPYANVADFLNLEQSLEKSLQQKKESIYAKRISSTYNQSEVKSVQRLPLPKGKSASWVALEYTRWLPKIMLNTIVSKREDKLLRIRVPLLKMDLLKLRFCVERSQEDRPLFYIEESKLVFLNKKARLEFRESPDKNFCVTAIHNFKPALPWYIYRWTQALAHKLVMSLFTQHLRMIAKKDIKD